MHLISSGTRIRPKGPSRHIAEWYAAMVAAMEGARVMDFSGGDEGGGLLPLSIRVG